jgi:hypothetical protein
MFRALSNATSYASNTCAFVLPFALALSAACGAETSEPPVAGTGGGAGQAAAPGSGGQAGTAAGTGGPAAGSSAPVAGTGAAGAGGAALELHGSFNITLVAPVEETGSAAMTSIIGKVNDGPTPSPAAWKQESEANGCKLYTPRVLFCDPACDRSAVCVDDDMCAAYPKTAAVGAVTLTGVGSGDVVMDPVAGNYQPKAGTSVPFPPCSEGGTITLAATGGGNAAFTLTARCIAPLDFKGPVALVDGQPLVLTWTASGQPDLARVLVKLDISHHGGAKGKIECDVPDTGMLTIPAEMTDALVDLGVAGFPSVQLTRRSTSAAGSGATKNVILNVSSPVERAVTIAGLTSCTEASECPDGQTCRADLTCGE